MAGGFYWTANSPFIRGFWIRLLRVPVAEKLTPELAIVDATPGRRTANPSHMIYECLTNTDWGEGSSAAELHIASFERSAQTLFDEGFGLAMKWAAPMKIEDFVSEILDHIQGVLFADPKTGLRTLKLLRNDYAPDVLPIYDPDNCKLTKFERKGGGETINEIVVSWTNPESEKEETVTIQDLASIIAQGGEIVSEPRKYYGIRNANLAAEAAARDIRSATAPLVVAEITCNRQSWSRTPGQCIKLNWPRRSIQGMILRVGQVDYGKKGEPEVRVQLIEDIFSLETASYHVPPPSEWQDPSQLPTPADFSRVFTLPWFLLDFFLNENNTSGDEIEYPEVGAGIMAATENVAAISYELVADHTVANGGIVRTSLGTRYFMGRGLLLDALTQEATSSIPAIGSYIGTPPYLAGFALFDGEGEQEDEIALVQAISEEDGFTLYRGVMDTTPKPWPADTPIWFFNLEQAFHSSELYADTEEVTFRVLTRTDRGLLSYEDADDLEGTLSDRPYRPLRPANVQVAGQGFGIGDLSGVDPVTITWANRNRLTETSQVLGWTNNSVTPETGQTTTIEVLDDDDNIIYSADGLAGTSHDIDGLVFDDNPTGTIRVFSERDGYVSLQAFELVFSDAGTALTVDKTSLTSDNIDITTDKG